MIISEDDLKEKPKSFFYLSAKAGGLGGQNLRPTMLYHLFEWFKEQKINFPGSGILEFITFRVLLAMLLSLVITTGVW